MWRIFLLVGAVCGSCSAGLAGIGTSPITYPQLPIVHDGLIGGGYWGGNWLGYEGYPAVKKSEIKTSVIQNKPIVQQQIIGKSKIGAYPLQPYSVLQYPGLGNAEVSTLVEKKTIGNVLGHSYGYPGPYAYPTLIGGGLAYTGSGIVSNSLGGLSYGLGGLQVYPGLQSIPVDVYLRLNVPITQRLALPIGKKVIGGGYVQGIPGSIISGGSAVASSASSASSASAAGAAGAGAGAGASASASASASSNTQGNIGVVRPGFSTPIYV